MKTLVLLITTLLLLSNLYTAQLKHFDHNNSRLYGSSGSLLIIPNDINNNDIFPASIGGIRGQTLSIGYLKWTDIINKKNIVCAFNSDSSSVIALSINYTSFEENQNYYKYLNLTDTINPYKITTNIQYSLVNVSYARRFYKSIQFGANIKYLNMDLSAQRINWLGTGLSFLYTKAINIKNFNLGIGVQNIGISKPEFNKENSGLGDFVYTGLTYKLLKIKNLEITTGTTYSFLIENRNKHISVGFNTCLFDFICLRTGKYLIKGGFPKSSIGLSIGKKKLFKIKFLKEIGLKMDYSACFFKNTISHSIQCNIIFTPFHKYIRKDTKYYKRKNIIIEEEEKKVFYNISENNIKLFNKGESKPTANMKEVLIQISELIKEESYKRVITLIYIKKNKKTNMNLYKKRGEAIKQFLINKKIDKNRLNYQILDFKDLQGNTEIEVDSRYNILLIRWKKEEKEKFNYYYFNGLDAYIKEGYSESIKEWEKALQIDPQNEELKRKLKEAKKKLKKKRDK